MENTHVQEHKELIEKMESKMYTNEFCLFFNTKEDWDYATDKLKAIGESFLCEPFDKMMFYVDNLASNDPEGFLAEFKKGHGFVYPYRLPAPIPYEAGVRFSLPLKDKHYEMKINDKFQVYDCDIQSMNGVYIYTPLACNIRYEMDTVPYDRKFIRFHTTFPWRGKGFDSENRIVDMMFSNKVELAIPFERGTTLIPEQKLKERIREQNELRKTKYVKEKELEKRGAPAVQEVKDFSAPETMEWLKHQVEEKKEE